MRERKRSIHSRVKALVAAECANHQTVGPYGAKDYCWKREKSNGGICLFFSPDIDNPRCRYFEEAVLPLNKDLKAVFSREVLNLEIQDGRKRALRKSCERCREPFVVKSNAQRFCQACQKWNENEKTRSRMANLRKRSIERSPVTV